MFEQIANKDPEDVPSGKRLIVGLAIGLVVPAALILAFHFGQPSHVPWVVSGKTLQIHAGIAWSEDYPACDLQVDKARIIDLNNEPMWKPDRKIYGFDGGSSYGNFYLKNGKEVEIALTDETVAVLLPRDGNVPLMIGVTDPDALLGALRNACK